MKGEISVFEPELECKIQFSKILSLSSQKTTVVTFLTTQLSYLKKSDENNKKGSRAGKSKKEETESPRICEEKEKVNRPTFWKRKKIFAFFIIHIRGRNENGNAT
jgi:hypothetical protein